MQDSYSSQGSRSIQAAGVRFPPKTQATVSLWVVNRSPKIDVTRRRKKIPLFCNNANVSNRPIILLFVQINKKQVAILDENNKKVKQVLT